VKLPTALNYLRLDLSANEGNWRGKIVVILFRFSQLFRGTKPQASWMRKLLLSPILFFEWVLGCEISPKAQIGPRFTIYHPMGIVIGPSSRIGSNFIIRQNCTVGQKNMLGDAPTIGNNVEMGSNSLILGAICVGNDVRLGANSLLISDAPNSGTYVGSPAKRLFDHGDAKGITGKND
jgi:putative colanic acid biosynthesis acetyltransferase WcaB